MPEENTPQNEIIKKIASLPADPEESLINSTAEELEMLSFAPILLVDIPDFLYMKKADVISEIYHILCMPEAELPSYDRSAVKSAEEFRDKQVNLIYFYFELLTRLRASEPEAWDYIHELYEDD